MFDYIKKLLYRKEEHIITNTSGIGRYLNNILGKTGEHVWNSPRLLVHNSCTIITLYTLRFLPKPQSYINLINQANQDKNMKVSTSANCKKLIVNSDGKMIFTPLSPNKMFPSNNYMHLSNMINRSIDVSENLKYYQVIPILINGEPGLGKSKSLDYIAYNTKIKEIIKVDLTSFINHNKISLNTILGSAIPSAINCHTLIIIDELDKYISSVCQSDESPEKINDVLLNHVLSLIESDSIGPYNIYMIFCSNNFDTIFDYIPNDRKIHYESLKDRFLKLIFHRMDKQEFIRYIYWLADQINTQVNKEWLEYIPEDFTITSRDLKNECLIKLYDIESICKNIRSSPLCKIIQSRNISPRQIKKEDTQSPEPIKEEKSYKKEYTDMFGYNYFDEFDWCSYANFRLNASNKNHLKLLYFVVDNKNNMSNNDLFNRCYEFPEIVLYLFNKDKKYVLSYVDFMHQLVVLHNLTRFLETITPEIIKELKKHRTSFVYYIYLYARNLVNGVKILSEFNDPSTIPIIEWFKLPVMQKIISRDREAITELDSLLKYSYTYNHIIIENEFNRIKFDEVNREILNNFLNIICK